MYHRTKVKIRAAGGEGDWFNMTTGIRQGCPLSPLIFAVVVDVLLRKLEVEMDGKGLTRAFADDTESVLEDLFAAMPRVAKLFDDYAAISGLVLNFSKTIIIPLWRNEERNYEEIGRLLAEIGGGWDQVLTRPTAKYLGFLVGPGRGDDIWTKA
eukprot:8029607-Heterocapsa_arctica.AAC.1